MNTKALLAPLRFVVYSNLWVASAVWALTKFTELGLHSSQPTLAWLNAGGTLIAYTFARFYDGPTTSGERSSISSWNDKLPKLSYLNIGLGAALLFWQIPQLPWRELFVPYVIAGSLALLYSLPVVGAKKGGGLRSIPGLKLLLISAVWAWVTGIIPAQLTHADQLGPIFWERFFWTAALTIPFDVRDHHIDARTLFTLPHLIGNKGAIITAQLFLWASGTIQYFLYAAPQTPYYLLFTLFSAGLVFASPKRGDLYISFFIEGYPWLLLGGWVLLPYL